MYSNGILCLFYYVLLASFVTLTSILRCQGFDTTIISTTIDDAEYEDKYSSSVVRVHNETSKHVAQIILLLNSKTVQELHLDGNGLTNLPNSILTLSKIESLSLVHNGISSIERILVINLLPRLRNLVLSYNPLKSMKGLAMPKLESLEAGFCQLQDIEGLLPEGLPSLKTLNLTGNILGTINGLVSDTLTDLVLKNCSLSHLNAETFWGLSNLTFLNLEENRLNTMPDELFLGQKNLRCLNLGSNQIKDLKKAWFSDMENLETLYLYKNEITFVDESDFTELPALRKLDFSGNKFTSLPNLNTTAVEVNFSRNCIRNKKVWDLSKMVKLHRLDLSHNRLEGNCDVFRSSSLGILILRYNKLSILKEECVSDLPNLSDIDLKGNRISQGVTPATFKHNPNLINMELDDNPWTCNCTELFPLYFYITTGQKTLTTHLICHSPKNASGHTWWEFCNPNWRGLLIVDHYIERGTMWIIVISAGFASLVIFGTMAYITYSFKKNRPAGS